MAEPKKSPIIFSLVIVLATWDIRSEESETCATKNGNGQASDQCICRYLGNWAERCYLLLVRGRKQRRKYNNIHSSCYDIILCQVSFTHSWYLELPRFMLLFGSHGVTHPAWERRLPCLVGSVEEQHTLADPESAAQGLDGVGLD